MSSIVLHFDYKAKSCKIILLVFNTIYPKYLLVISQALLNLLMIETVWIVCEGLIVLFIKEFESRKIRPRIHIATGRHFPNCL